MDHARGEAASANGNDLDPDIRHFIRTIADSVARYPEFNSAPNPQVRRWAEEARAGWVQGGPAMAGFGLGLGLRHRGELFGDGANQFKSDSVTMHDAILHYDTQNWRIAVNASNFTDEIFVDRCSSVSNCFYGTRRLVTGSVTRKF